MRLTVHSHLTNNPLKRDIRFMTSSSEDDEDKKLKKKLKKMKKQTT
jgi:hypothetical protein